MNRKEKDKQHDKRLVWKIILEYTLKFYFVIDLVSFHTFDVQIFNTNV